MKIILCDDDQCWLWKAAEILEAYGKTHALEMTLDTYTEPASMLKKTEEEPDLLFMDIELEQENGIAAVQEINQKWPLCEVVYLTNYIYYATEVYETEHAYFVLKNEFEERLEKVIRKVQSRQERNQESLLFHVINGGEIRLNATDIVCFERFGRKTKITFETSDLAVWDKLDDILEKLPADDFVRCHNSYIVSLAAVKEYHRDFFLMQNDMVITISRSYRRQVQDAFLQWSDREMLS